MARIILLHLNTALVGGLLFANLYNSLVDAPAWGHDLPGSIEVARRYFRVTTPADFFSIFGGVANLSSLLSLALCWRGGAAIRVSLGLAFALLMLIQLLTVSYFFPRNDVLFHPAAPLELAALSQAWRQWSAMNWVRSFLALLATGLDAYALHRVYDLRPLRDNGFRVSTSFAERG